VSIHTFFGDDQLGSFGICFFVVTGFLFFFWPDQWVVGGREVWAVRLPESIRVSSATGHVLCGTGLVALSECGAKRKNEKFLGQGCPLTPQALWDWLYFQRKNVCHFFFGFFCHFFLCVASF
jgi:hypothetical protein